MMKNPLRATWHHVVGVVDTLGLIRKQEGVRALWKGFHFDIGLGPTLVGVVPARFSI